ncbi:sigma-54 dependent transcriptional regulator, partial [Ramlibacter sp. 2FC]|uniref:sigma-54-dependent transcriptional regulator n=1 Tax=Ramlibacter sp. 2FC TaxID=2502188 RepID=UPI0032E4D518
PALVLVVDDEPDLRTLYELTLLREGHRVEAAGTLAEAWQQLGSQRFDAVITDMRLPDGLGLSLLQGMKTQQRPERCVMITAYGSAENAVEALKAGAFDYLTKPVDLKQLRGVVASAIADRRSAAKADRPDLPPAGDAQVSAAGQAALARLVGPSAAMAAVRQRVVKAARSMAPVLVHGESGTGKELVARALHASSHRAERPFVAVNCGAIPETLLEAEFFGVRKGAYTGATQDRDGFFQAAAGGTLFLDEIGDLPLAMQAKLLRVIQERHVRPLGATQEELVDVRIVSATHKDLAAEVQAGRFRQDLYYRLNVIDILVPALRERRQDLPALCDALLQRIAADSGHPPLPSLSPELLQQLEAHPLPGNVRELENLLHRAVALGEADMLHIASQAAPAPEAGAGEAQSQSPLPDNLAAWLDQCEREILLRTLQETGFNRTAAAARLGLNLRQIRYRMARLQITGPNSEAGADDTD